jgi:hypothetical protein
LRHPGVLSTPQRARRGKAFSGFAARTTAWGSLWVKGFTPLDKGRRAEAGPGPYRVHPWLDHLEAGIMHMSCGVDKTIRAVLSNQWMNDIS